MRWHMQNGVVEHVVSANILVGWMSPCRVRRIARTLDQMGRQLIGANAKRKVAMRTYGKNGRVMKMKKYIVAVTVEIEKVYEVEVEDEDLAKVTAEDLAWNDNYGDNRVDAAFAWNVQEV